MHKVILISKSFHLIFICRLYLRHGIKCNTICRNIYIVLHLDYKLVEFGGINDNQMIGQTQFFLPGLYI